MSDDPGLVFLPKDQRLRGPENYDLWSSRVKTLLMSKGLEDQISDSCEAPQPISTADNELVPNPEAKAWRQTDGKALMCIQCNIDDKAIQLIRDCHTAREAWKTLRDQYQGKCRSLQLKYMFEIFTVERWEVKTTRAFIDAFKTAIANLHSVEGDNMDLFYQFAFIRALEDDYPAWAERQRAPSGTEKRPSLQDLMNDVAARYL